MLLLFSVVLLGLFLLYIFNTYKTFNRRLAAARQSGLRYIISPIFLYNRTWLITQRLFIPSLRRLPTEWTKNWLPLVISEWVWQDGHTPFETLGTDSFLIVAPGGTAFFTCDPEAISQITSRRNDFPKPTEIYESVNVYGPNVVGTEGSVWRHHRKITSAPFTERNNELVWRESMKQCRAMLNGWLSGPSRGLVENIGSDTMRLTLHVISRAGFGKSMAWPSSSPSLQGAEITTNGDAANLSSDEVPRGHTLSYKQALTAVIHNILWIILTPRALLRRSPFAVHKKAWSAFVDWRLYMQEMLDGKVAEARSGDPRSGLDLMDALVKGAGITSTSNASDKGTGQLLSNDEILGNAFIFILAGHETTATTTQMAMLYLATHPTHQARLQADLDTIFAGRKSDDWTYEHDLPRLFSGYAGAVMNETLRLTPPVVIVPKVVRDVAQPLTLRGQRYLVPAETRVSLNVVAAQRNPKYWPAGSPPVIASSQANLGMTNDLAEFKPERWLLHQSGTSTPASGNPPSTTSTTALEEPDEFGGPGGRDTAATMFHPTRGAYLAFSEGARACLGRRFAQVEVLTVLATVFTQYSIELDVGDHDLDTMTASQKRPLWARARERTDYLMTKGMSSLITLQMREGVVKVRLVERGREHFRGEGY